MLKFNFVTIFPEIIKSYCDASILGRAQKNNLIVVNPVNLRDFTEDKRKTVDDTPYGGGPGMVMKPEPIFKALQSLNAIPFKKDSAINKVKRVFTGDVAKKRKTILLSPRGRQFNQKIAEEWSKYSEITFVCGRYEGVDQRVSDFMIDEEISVGPYILAGGELGALTITEVISRLIPGVLGNAESLDEETFGSINSKAESQNLKAESSQVEYPQYTKPSEFMGCKVPKVLLSGDHKKVKEWRENRTG